MDVGRCFLDDENQRLSDRKDRPVRPRNKRLREETHAEPIWICVPMHRLSALTVLGVLIAGMGISNAQTKYPDKPVRIILPYGPGGVADVTMRLVAQKLSEKLGQNFFIDNRPGAGGIIAAKAAIAAPPDGYTLTVSGNSMAISETLFKSLPFNPMKDFTSISTLAEFEMLLATKGDSQIDSVAKLVAYAQDQSRQDEFRHHRDRQHAKFVGRNVSHDHGRESHDRDVPHNA